MDEKGLEIDEYTQSALTRMYIDARMVEKSWLWFMRFHRTGNMTSECYYDNIDAYGVGRNERFNDAVATFKEMLDDDVGVMPDDCTFKSLGLVLVKCGLSKRAVARLEAGLKKDY
ncbi:unnamed protein product [Linum tenue]|uniref:Pentatricopeptide repeat-containing protein n=1 Tax=Linum tenue TaxID=586396 RepID=A0AAV0RNY5_9ROSI|nr:unnamed protein product [Linum tenue]